MSSFLQDRRNSKHALVYGDKRRQHDLATSRASVATSVQQIWWEGRDNTRGTLVSNGGSQTLTESNVNWPRLEVSAVSGIAVGDVNALMFPASISVGDAWRCEIRVNPFSTNQFLFGTLIMADGTATTSNIAQAYLYQNTDGGVRNGGSAGTYTNFFATAVNDGDIVATTSPFRQASWLLEIVYLASNQFTARAYGGDGRNASAARTSSPINHTMTPTHIGIGWSNYGGTPTTPLVTYGPIYKV